MSTLNVNRIVDASGGVLAPISSVMRNRLIDAGFTINQRGYVSGTALSAGAYAHDRFKAGASGCTYTFTQLATGVPIVITITAGSLQQVIEGANMPEGGTYVLSWTGTAQARFNGGTYSNSPLAVTGITAGANTTIEFGIGTCSFPQLERGTQATSFEYRQYQQELALCQRYFEKSYATTVVPATATDDGRLISISGVLTGNASAVYAASVVFAVEKRAAPTVTPYDGSGNSGKITTFNAVATPSQNVTPTYGFGETSTRGTRMATLGNIAGIGCQWVAAIEL